MAKILSLCFIFLLSSIIPICGGCHDNKGDKDPLFEKSTLNELIQNAKNRDKLIFIDCYTSWCGPCKKMSNTVFKDETVIKFLKEHFLSLKVNMEDEGDGRMIYEKYKIYTFPTFLILDTERNEIGRFTGACESNDFIGKIKIILEINSKKNK